MNVNDSIIDQESIPVSGVHTTCSPIVRIVRASIIDQITRTMGEQVVCTPLECFLDQLSSVASHQIPGSLKNKFEQVSSLRPPDVTSRGLGSCTEGGWGMRSKASWVMVTWEP